MLRHHRYATNAINATNASLQLRLREGYQLWPVGRTIHCLLFHSALTYHFPPFIITQLMNFLNMFIKYDLPITRYTDCSGVVLCTAGRYSTAVFRAIDICSHCGSILFDV